MNKVIVPLAAIALLAGALSLPARAAPPPASAPERIVHDAMQRWVDQGKLIGAAAALYVNGQARIVTVGSKDRGGAALDAHTLFSIGSLTKVFTAAMLAKLLDAGTVKLATPVDGYLPDYTHLRPEVRGKLTFERLATFTASQPDGSPPRLKTPRQYFDYLSRWRPGWPIGSRDSYSDQSYMILAWVVPRIAGTDYRSLLRDFITAPLDMPDTTPVVGGNPDADRAYGYGRSGRRATYDRSSWNGVGFLLSTPADMLNFLEACLGVRGASPALQSALRLSRQPYFRMSASSEQGFAWVIRRIATQYGEQTFVSKNGATPGFYALIVLEPAHKMGVVFMTNRDQQAVPHAPHFYMLARRAFAAAMRAQ